MPKALPTLTDYPLTIESGNPLPRAAFLAVFLLELAARLLLGQDGNECWQAPALHAFAAWLGVRLLCRVIDGLYDRLRASIFIR